METMILAELRKLWSGHFDFPPELRATDLIRLILSWRLQARAYGTLDARTPRKLRRNTMADPVSSTDLEIGCVLHREPQGTTYEAELDDGGFNWEDKT